MTNRFFTTSAIILDHNFYCPYCGKQLGEYIERDDCKHTVQYYHNCDCEDAYRELKIRCEMKKLENKLCELKSQLPPKKFELKQQIVKI